MPSHLWVAGTLVAPPSAFPALGAKGDDFPDLAAAAKVKETRKDKKKKATKQVLSLQEFLNSDIGGSGPPLGGGRRGGGDVDILSLPTAPRPRGEGEERPDRPLGGGFREYGGREGEPACVNVVRPAPSPRLSRAAIVRLTAGVQVALPCRQTDAACAPHVPSLLRYHAGAAPRSTGGRRFDDERRPRRGDEEDMGPSRAEMSDNWGADRKFAASEDRGRGGFGGGFRERDGGFRDRSRCGPFAEYGSQRGLKSAGLSPALLLLPRRVAGRALMVPLALMRRMTGASPSSLCPAGPVALTIARVAASASAAQASVSRRVRTLKTAGAGEGLLGWVGDMARGRCRLGAQSHSFALRQIFAPALMWCRPRSDPQAWSLVGASRCHNVCVLARLPSLPLFQSIWCGVQAHRV